jgi:hypothetical protein
MELTFTELDNIDDSNKTYYNNVITKTNTIPIASNNNINQSSLQKNNSKPKKKTISYDDILSSMNTIVIDGKLEFIRKDTLQNIVENQQQKLSLNNKKVSFNKIPPENNNQSQIDKSSYIYNKFFKGYKEPNQNLNEEVKQPLTKKELINLLIINKINAINERNRIAEIKSTKLMFNNNNNRNITINSRLNSNVSGIGMNHLFKFK